MCPTLLEALDMKRDVNGILVFKDYLPVAPSRPVGKLYDVKVEAMIATSEQIKSLTAIGALRPSTTTGKVPAPVSKANTRGSTSASFTAGGGTAPAPTPAAYTAASPAASPDKSMNGYGVEIVDGEVLLIEKRRFIIRKYSAEDMIDLKLSSREFEEDEAQYKAEKEQYDKDIIKIRNELPAITQKMWQLISDDSQIKVAKLMGCELANAKNLIAFETLRVHICDTHHPELHSAQPNTKDFYVSIEKYATNEMQVNKLKMTDTESLAQYRKRIETLIKRCKTAAAIGVKASTLSFIAFIIPSTKLFIHRIIEAINMSADKAFNLCEAYRGNFLGYTPTIPTTIDDLFDELEKAQAKTDSKSILKAKEKDAKKEFIANVHANFGEMDIVSM